MTAATESSATHRAACELDARRDTVLKCSLFWVRSAGCGRSLSGQSYPYRKHHRLSQVQEDL